MCVGKLAARERCAKASSGPEKALFSVGSHKNWRVTVLLFGNGHGIGTTFC